MKVAVRLEKPLIERARRAAAKAGYSSVEEFIQHAIEKVLTAFEEAEGKEEMMKQLRGLGYID